jgi:hypothetical protein
MAAEDEDVVLWFSGRGIGRDAMIGVAAAAARRLRENS